MHRAIVDLGWEKQPMVAEHRCHEVRAPCGPRTTRLTQNSALTGSLLSQQFETGQCNWSGRNSPGVLDEPCASGAAMPVTNNRLLLASVPDWATSDNLSERSRFV
jgi:hypothetical protein